MHAGVALFPTLLLATGLAAAPAHASPLALARDGAASPEPLVLIACEPARTLARVGRLAPLDKVVEKAPDNALVEVLGLLLTAPEEARRLGVDADGALRLEAWAGGGELRIPVEAAGPGALVARLGAELTAEGAVVLAGETIGHREDGRLVLREGAPAAPRPGATADPLLAGLPDVPGCLMAGGVPGRAARLAAFWPAEGDEHVVLRMATGTAPPAIMAAPAGPPAGGSSLADPLLVGVLGVSPLTLVQDPQVATALKLSDQDRSTVAQMAEELDIGPGATFALFLASGGVDVAAVVPLVRPDGKKVRVRRLVRGTRKMLKAEGGEVTRLGRNGLRAAMRKQTWTLVFTEDRAYIGTLGDAVLDAAAGRGAPWVDPRTAELAARQTLALVLDTEGSLPGMPDLRVEGGLRALETAWELRLLVQGTPEMLQAVGAGLGQAIQQGKQAAEAPPAP